MIIHVCYNLLLKLGDFNIQLSLPVLYMLLYSNSQSVFISTHTIISDILRDIFSECLQRHEYLIFQKNSTWLIFIAPESMRRIVCESILESRGHKYATLHILQSRSPSFIPVHTEARYLGFIPCLSRILEARVSNFCSCAHFTFHFTTPVKRATASFPNSVRL